MKFINKGSEPAEWAEFCQTPDVGFDDARTPIKNALKESLLEDQGFICCYCGKRIELNSQTILEHLLPREKYPQLAIAYTNLLCSCDGGQGDRRNGDKRHPVYCDNKKKDKILLLTPLHKNCEEQFRYEDDGSVTPLTSEAKQVVCVLYLDNHVLRNRRKAVIEALRDESKTYQEWEREIEIWNNRDASGMYEEYCFVAVSYIKNYKLVV